MARRRKKEDISFKEQFVALKNLPPFFKLIWETHKGMALGNGLLRLVKAAIPLAVLWVGKEIVDEVIRLIDAPVQDMGYLWTVVAIELVLVVGLSLIHI